MSKMKPADRSVCNELCTSRRDFLRTAAAPVVLAALGISLPSCKSEVIGLDDAPGITIDGNEIILDLTVPELEPLTQAGGFLLIRQASTMVINLDGTTLRAFTSICTHEQCTITSFQGDFFECPCHFSRYDTSGEVIQGPAEDDLDEFDVERDGDIVVITK